MAAFASASASARDADAGASVFDFEGWNATRFDIPASQKELLARSRFLVGGPGGGEEEEAEVFSTPPLGEGEDGIAMCSMPFTQTQPSSPLSPSSPPSDSRQRKPRKPRKPRVCMRKVRRGGAKLRTPTPSPSRSPELHPPTPGPNPSPELHPPPTPGPSPSPELHPPPTPGPSPILELHHPPTPGPSPSPELDPLVRIILMIPTAPLPDTNHLDMLEIARSRGLL